MQTYPCPFCGATRFVIQDIKQEEGVVALGVRLECAACQTDQLKGRHWQGSGIEFGRFQREPEAA
jgi:hypothetical protein